MSKWKKKNMETHEQGKEVDRAYNKAYYIGENRRTREGKATFMHGVLEDGDLPEAAEICNK